MYLTRIIQLVSIILPINYTGIFAIFKLEDILNYMALIINILYCYLVHRSCEDTLPLVCKEVSSNELKSFCSIAFNSNNCKKTCDTCQRTDVTTEKDLNGEYICNY